MESRLSLIVLSLIFVVVAAVTLSYAWRGAFAPDSCVIDFKVYESGSLISDDDSQSCYCVKGSRVCQIKETDVSRLNLSVSDFTRDNLDFKYKYFASGVSTELLSSELGVDFTSVKRSGNSLTVEILQSQLCDSKGNPPVQIGLYNLTESILSVMNVVNTIETLYKVPCTVSLNYSINKLDIESYNDFKLVYQSEAGEKVVANICLYGDNVYNNGDNYVSEDGCNLCRCVEGVSKCSTDKVCGTKD